MKPAAVPDLEVGLCRACRRARVVRSDRGSVFYQCRRSFTDPAYPAYPRLPVLHCAGYEPEPETADAPRGFSGDGC